MGGEGSGKACEGEGGGESMVHAGAFHPDGIQLTSCHIACHSESWTRVDCSGSLLDLRSPQLSAWAQEQACSLGRLPRSVPAACRARVCGEETGLRPS